MNAEVLAEGRPTPCSGHRDECAHVFGPGLIGVLHHPRGPAPSRTAVILMNAGLTHRVGPFRRYVQLARALAAAGFPVLRFDQGGLGDSEVSRLDSVSRRREELAAAMSLLVNEVSATDFVLGGICTGADDAFLLAGFESRIAGVFLLDGFAYRTLGFWWHVLMRELRTPGHGLSLWKKWRDRRDRPGADEYREVPTRAEAVAQLGALVARDVRVLFIQTGGNNRHFNHSAQLRASLGDVARARQVALDYWPDCDHTFYLQQHRERVQRRLTAWMVEEFGGRTSACSTSRSSGSAPDVEH